MTQPVLVAGIGNLFCSDDGFGPEVVRRLTAEGTFARDEDVRVVDYGIRGVHLAYDLLDGYDGLVLVDAVPGAGPPGEVTALEVTDAHVAAGDGAALDAHGMTPAAVLANLSRLGGALPRTYVVGCRPATVAEGIGLSPAVAGAVAEAVRVVSVLVERLRSDAPVTQAVSAETGRA